MHLLCVQQSSTVHFVGAMTVSPEDTPSTRYERFPFDKDLFQLLLFKDCVLLGSHCMCVHVAVQWRFGCFL